MAFILIRSPSNAPPVFFFEGSTDITAIVFVENLCKYLLTISSVTEDLPAPPVPVIPKTGIFLLLNATESIASTTPFSALVIFLATFLMSIEINLI